MRHSLLVDVNERSLKMLLEKEAHQSFVRTLPGTDEWLSYAGSPRTNSVLPAELGERTDHAQDVKARAVWSNNQPPVNAEWRPQGMSFCRLDWCGTMLTRQCLGILVAQLMEHTGSITGLRVSSDQLLLASGSTDGSIRVWDLSTMANAISRSIAVYQQGNPRAYIYPRLICVSQPSSAHTHTHTASSIQSLTFIDRTHSIASCDRDGFLHIFR